MKGNQPEARLRFGLLSFLINTTNGFVIPRGVLAGACIAAVTNDLTLPLTSVRAVDGHLARALAMSLDKNLFTLQFTPSPEDPNVISLVDPSGVVHYRKNRTQGSTYEIHVYGNAICTWPLSAVQLSLPSSLIDPISGSQLIRGSSPNPASRHKTLELYNPSTIIELKDVGKVSFRWSFKWEE